MPETALDNWQPIWNAQVSISTPVFFQFRTVSWLCESIRIIVVLWLWITFEAGVLPLTLQEMDVLVYMLNYVIWYWNVLSVCLQVSDLESQQHEHVGVVIPFLSFIWWGPHTEGWYCVTSIKHHVLSPVPAGFHIACSITELAPVQSCHALLLVKQPWTRWANHHNLRWNIDITEWTQTKK